MTPTGTVHIAGLDVHVGPYLRQRCAWCSQLLIDEDLRLVAVQCTCGRTETPHADDCPAAKPVATWQVGALVEVVGEQDQVRASWVVEHKDGDDLPANACGALDPAVTA